MIVQFKLSRYFLRPVITVNCGGEEYPALIDTGAVVPVFTFGQEKIAEIGGRSLYRTASDDAARTLTVDTRTNETDLRLRIYDGTGEFRVLVGSAKSGDQSGM